jgi:hypothetical protein
MKSRLDYIESRLQALIETSLAWLPWRSEQPRMAEKLIDAVKGQILREVETNQPAANVLHIFMHPSNASLWLSHSDWQNWLLKAVTDLGYEAGITFFAAPEISIKPEDSLNKREVRVIAAFPSQDINSTAVMTVKSAESTPLNSSELVAFLILQNKETFPLDQPVINIGRRSDNHLIIDDMRVSREHAQIRRVRGSPTLFDLNSTGGTFVNGIRITQHTLLAGDVISFGGVAMIYGEEPVQKSTSGGTSPSKLNQKDQPDQ